ncbi:MAG: hypothetical protein Q9199_003068 [Rusavskia elegans]
MGRCRRPLILGKCLDNRVVTFPDHKQWQLTKKLSEKSWEGSTLSERAKWADWEPDEAHAVYECVQTRGPKVGTKAIVKVRVDDPKERAKEASGMRFDVGTTREIKTLEELTSAGCSVTPRLLGVKIDVQDSLVLDTRSKSGFGTNRSNDIDWWIPGGYIVYILMTRLQAQPLDINTFWNEKFFTKQDRDNVRSAFQKSYIELRKFGVIHCDTKLENLMWDKISHKCYIIDLEDTAYDTEPNDPEFWSEGEYTMWNLARRWGTPNW